jgi:pimeloyl-ACP methyl ester carboxylesterase
MKIIDNVKFSGLLCLSVTLLVCLNSFTYGVASPGNKALMGGFAYVNPKLFHDSFAHDVNSTETDIMAIVQKPPNFSPMLGEKSGPPAWKQLPTWYQVSESDRLIPREVNRTFAERMNATILSLNSSHMSQLSHPDEVADLILNATMAR